MGLRPEPAGGALRQRLLDAPGVLRQGHPPRTPQPPDSLFPTLTRRVSPAYRICRQCRTSFPPHMSQLQHADRDVAIAMHARLGCEGLAWQRLSSCVRAGCGAAGMVLEGGSSGRPSRHDGCEDVSAADRHRHGLPAWPGPHPWQPKCRSVRRHSLNSSSWPVLTSIYSLLSRSQSSGPKSTQQSDVIGCAHGNPPTTEHDLRACSTGPETTTPCQLAARLHCCKCV